MIRRSKPLKRTALKGPTLEAVRAWEQKPRRALPRGKLPARVGRRGKRLEAAWVTCKLAVRERSGGFCEANIEGVCQRGLHSADDTHHVWPEDRAAGVHDPLRCLHLCRRAHDWCDAEYTKARRAGVIRPLSDVPGIASRGPECGVVSES